MGWAMLAAVLVGGILGYCARCVVEISNAVD